MLSSAIGDDPLPQFNASLADDDHVKVAVRIRPLNQTESARGDACVLSVHSTDARQAVLTVPDVYGGTNQYMNGSGHTPISASSANTAVRSFPFHACIGPEANQAEVLRLCGITQMLDAALDGYNATILAVSTMYFSFPLVACMSHAFNFLVFLLLVEHVRTCLFHRKNLYV
jgi:hypothetical protein